jgi:hypothetical protein
MRELLLFLNWAETLSKKAIMTLPGLVIDFAKRPKNTSHI